MPTKKAETASVLHVILGLATGPSSSEPFQQSTGEIFASYRRPRGPIDHGSRHEKSRNSCRSSIVWVWLKESSSVRRLERCSWCCAHGRRKRKTVSVQDNLFSDHVEVAQTQQNVNLLFNQYCESVHSMVRVLVTSEISPAGLQSEASACEENIPEAQSLLQSFQGNPKGSHHIHHGSPRV